MMGLAENLHLRCLPLSKTVLVRDNIGLLGDINRPQLSAQDGSQITNRSRS